jgi:hypothetical protein
MGADFYQCSGKNPSIVLISLQNAEIPKNVLNAAQITLMFALIVLKPPLLVQNAGVHPLKNTLTIV